MEIEFRRIFLKNIKKIIINNGCIPTPRAKNVDFMRKYFLDDKDLREIILDLSPSDCIGGPEPDRDGYPGHILKFKSSYLDEVIIYIKIRYNPPEQVIIISFHEDE
ncbi:hypothetical protein [Tissierella creatinophila]|uniref:Uncharacterized protein n=1 Tax=Tissierella creatinophila DSM 6911 TaxID=1123403 RepID=A0A1U7M5A6_TISCR|nr:hypothetical protein [Tissierella creatinophila]OLS02471.1 hypothetical protein TICRE_15520 [Tissierella creatinophila DSM 6911]